MEKYTKSSAKSRPKIFLPSNSSILGEIKALKR